MLLPHWLADLFTRFGLILGFLSFVLVTPEVIGEERLGKLQESVRDGLSMLPYRVAEGLVWVAAAVIFMWAGVWQWSLFPARSWGAYKGGWVVLEVRKVVMAFVCTGVWWGVHGVARKVRGVVERRLVKPLVGWLLSEGHWRRVLFLFGVWFFIASFLLQFWATFPAPEKKEGAKGTQQSGAAGPRTWSQSRVWVKIG